jgi:uncharacterized protein involved in outer membrane biogenesis
MSRYRRLKRILISIFVVAIAALGTLWLSLDRLVTTSIEGESSKALGVSVKVENLKLNPFNGQLAIAKLTIDNPAGFATDYLMRFDRLALKLQPLSLLGEDVKIDDFTLDRVDLNIEQKLNRNNAADIASFLQQNQPPPDRRARKQKFQVNQVAIERAMATVTVSYLLSANTWDFAVDNITLRAVTPENASGLVLQELSGKLVSAIVKALLQANRDKIPLFLQPLIELMNKI